MKSYDSTYLTVRTVDGWRDATIEPFCTLDSRKFYFQVVQSDVLSSEKPTSLHL